MVLALAFASGCSEFVEGQQQATDDDEGTTTVPSGITLTTPNPSGPTTSSPSSTDTTDGDPTGDPPTTGDPDETTTGDPDGTSTVDPSLGTSDDGASTGTAVGAGFLDCLNDGKKAVCTGAEMCIYDIAADPSVGVCAGMNCTDVSECPDAPPGGDAMPVCTDIAVPDGNECILDCSGGEACPTGMICYRDILCVWAQEGLELEDFEDGLIPASWTLHDVDGNTPASSVSFIDEAWVVAMTGGGDVVAASTSWYSPAGTADDWLVTPPIAIGPASSLSFEARAPDPDFPDGYEVRISTTGSAVEGFMANSPLLTVAAETNSFTPHTIDLAAAGYADQTVWIAWRNTSNDKYLLQVDDIEVTY
jgi:hypothetical protein